MLRTPWHGGPICCAPHGMGDLFAAQFVCVGFHTSPGEGAAPLQAAVKINREDTVKHEGAQRKNGH